VRKTQFPKDSVHDRSDEPNSRRATVKRANFPSSG
jgi:hypothetical protein